MPALSLAIVAGHAAEVDLVGIPVRSFLHMYRCIKEQI